MKKVQINAVDLFCGAGALTKGLENAGINVALGVDIDPACEYPYTTNNRARFLLRSVEKLESSEIKGALAAGDFSLIAGCAPCQPFSTYRWNKSDKTDGRWYLLRSFQRIALTVKPTVITIENVPGLAEQAVFRRFVSALEKAKYHVWWGVVSCVEYNVPQTRARLILLASKLGPISMIAPNRSAENPVTVRQTISRLAAIEAGESYERDRLHCAASLSEINLKRIRASRPGGTWRDWDKDLIAKCHRKKSGKTYPGVYGRMSWDEPGPTITTQFFGFGNGRFGHPEQDRAISLREGARLQTFPANYRFVKPGAEISYKVVGRLIGNAVPVKLAEAVGKSIMLHVEAHSDNRR